MYIAKVNFDEGKGLVKAGSVYKGNRAEALLKEGLIEAPNKKAKPEKPKSEKPKGLSNPTKE